MPTIDGIAYPDTLRGIAADRALMRVFERYYPSQCTSRSRAFLAKSNNVNAKNAHTIFEMSGLHDNKNHLDLPANDVRKLKGMLSRNNHLATDFKKMAAIVKEMRTLVKIRTMQMAIVPFYKSANFEDYHGDQLV